MRRVETYVGQQVYEWLFSSQAQHTMTAIAKVCAALLGTSGIVNGLACTPTSPATMTVQIGAGEIYQMESLEATTCGTLPADTTHQILKQGIQLGTYTTATFAAPGTSGQSINYLIEAQYQDSDISVDPTTGNTPVVLQFYNSTNPSSPWSGPNNSGSTSNTFRDGVIAYQIKAGAAATTGSQVTPTPDSGWIGLWVVTVPFGASSITNTNISQYTGSPILPNGILQSVLTSNLTYGIDSGTAGVVQAKFPIPVTALVDGMDVWVKIAASNPTTATFTPNPGVIAPAPVVGAAHAALQGGELVAGGRANLVYRADITSWVLVECTGAPIQIAPATQSQHALQAGQALGLYLGTQIITSSQTVNPGVYTIAGRSVTATKWRVRGVGGGGAGGGAAATASGTISLGTGGQSGAYCEFYMAAASTSATIGAGGTPGSGASGGAGGNSSFGSLATCPGGAGGSVAGPAVAPFSQVTSGGTGNPTGTATFVVSMAGSLVGTPVSPGANGALISGYGGGCPLGTGGNATIGSAGGGGTGKGSGGSGAANGPSVSATAGGAGAPGIWIVDEFA